MPRFMGDDFTARDEKGDFKVCIATIFPVADTIVTFPHTHAEQRNAYVDFLNRQRQEQGRPLLSQAEEFAELTAAVDLLLNNQSILIRPDASQMDLASAADEIVQAVPSCTRPVQFMNRGDPQVRESLKRRGECWRIFQPPTDPTKIRQMVADAKSAIHGRAIYYYSPTTGTRWLTLQCLSQLIELDPAELQKHIEEIANYSAKQNMTRHYEVAFFQFNKAVSSADFEALVHAPQEELRDRFKSLCALCRQGVPQAFVRDNHDDATWMKAMFDLLVCQRGDKPGDDRIMGLDPDFSMRVEWVPGGRIEAGELILDFAQEPQAGNIVQRLILNLVQESGNLEYINVGSVLPSPSRNLSRGGRREVYVAQLKRCRASCRGFANHPHAEVGRARTAR